MKKTMGLLISGFSVLTLAACQPPAKDEAKANKPIISALNEKAASCEEKLIAQMKAQALPMIAVKALEKPVAAANKLMQINGEKKFDVTKIQNQIVSLSVSNSVKKDGTIKSVSWSLKKPDANSKYILKASAQVEQKTSDSNKRLDQEWGIDSNCEPHALDSEYSITQRKDESHVSTEKFTVFADGTNKNENYEAQIDPSLDVASFITKYEDFKSDIPVGYKSQSINGQDVYLLSVTKETEPREFKEFGQTLILMPYDISLHFKGQKILSFKMYRSDDVAYTMTDSTSSQSWTIPEPIFDQQRLGSPVAASYMTGQLGAEYLQKNLRYEIIGKNRPTYEFFSAYMQIISERKESDGNTVYVLQQGTGEFETPVTAQDLASNDTIQTTLPQIQKIAKDIASQSSDRKEQIKLILKYLKKNYVYDWDLIKNNTLRALTASEALERGKGVCQHYAVLFVTIARALKIPSTVVIGYSMADGNPGPHAWVEAETSKNRWTVIEPQSENGLTDTAPRAYFPLARHTYFEDQKQGLTNTSVSFLQNIFMIRELSH
jgi:Transglutaminase-like enzymes, putative cysteine proteases